MGAYFRLSNLRQGIVWEAEAITLSILSGYRAYEARALIGDKTMSFQELNQQLQTPSRGTRAGGVLHGLKDWPLYGPVNYLLIFFWGELVGFGIDRVRMVPAILGLLSIFASYFLGWQLWRSHYPAAISAAFLAISPLSVHFSREIRECSLSILLTLLTCGIFIRALRTGKRVDWLFYSLIIAIDCYSSFILAALVIANGVFALIYEKPWKSSPALKSLIVASIGGIAMAAPRIYDFLSQYHHAISIVSWLKAPVDTSWLLTGWLRNFSAIFLYVQDGTYEWALKPVLAVPICWLFLVMMIISAIIMWRKDRKCLIYLALLCSITLLSTYVPDLVFGGRRSLYSRYILFLPLATLYLLSFGVWQSFCCRKNWQRYAICGIVALILMTETYFCLWDIAQPERNFLEQLKPISEIVNSDPQLLVTMEGSHSTNLAQILGLSHSIKGSTRVLYLSSPQLSPLPEGCRTFFIFHPPPELLESAAKAGFQASCPVKDLYKMQK